VIVIGLVLAVPGLVGITFGFGYALLLASFFGLGLFLNGIGPVAYQYGAEITYPAPEGTSNGLLMLAGQLSVVMISGMGWSDARFGSFVPSLLALVGLLLVSAVLLALAKESPMMQAQEITTEKVAPTP
jgi:hypothetical protein